MSNNRNRQFTYPDQLSAEGGKTGYDQGKGYNQQYHDPPSSMFEEHKNSRKAYHSVLDRSALRTPSGNLDTGLGNPVAYQHSVYANPSQDQIRSTVPVLPPRDTLYAQPIPPAYSANQFQPHQMNPLPQHQQTTPLAYPYNMPSQHKEVQPNFQQYPQGKYQQHQPLQDGIPLKSSSVPQIPPIQQNVMNRMAQSTSILNNAHPLPDKRPSLDPRQVPTPIQVQEMDQNHFRKHVYSRSSNLIPPLASTDFIYVDEGDSSPKFVRSTLQEIPCTEDVLKSVSVELGLVIQPFAQLRADEQKVPVVETNGNGPIRCERCKAYINANVIFKDNGYKYLCNICGLENNVPGHYYCDLDANGKRSDTSRRPELCFGTVDFTATKDYCNKPPQRPVIAFMIDVSLTSIRSGMVVSACKAIKAYIDANREKATNEKFCIITYDKNIHFYYYGKNHGQIEMKIVADIDSHFIPMDSDSVYKDFGPDALSKTSLLLDYIQKMFVDTSMALSCMGSAIKIVSKSMERIGGRIVVFQNSLVNHGSGIVSIRHNNPNNTTDKAFFLKQNDYYNELGKGLSLKGISVDIFYCLSIPYVDLATVGMVSFVTGGKLHPYFNFSREKDEESMIRDLHWSLCNPYVFEGLIRVRVGNGLSISGYHGNFNMRNATDIELARIDSDHTIGVTLKYDGKLASRSKVGIQVAILYTNKNGVRLIRILNLNLYVTDQVPNVFRHADLDSVICLIVKSHLSRIATLTLSQIRQKVVEGTIKILASYRKLCSSGSSSGQLILPEAFKLLPIYTLSFIKSKLLRDGRDISPDKRVHLINAIKSSPCSINKAFLYPTNMLFTNGLLEDPEKAKERESLVKSKLFDDYARYTRKSLSFACISPNDIYVLENGMECLVWVGAKVSSNVLQQLFNVSVLSQVNILTIGSTENKLSTKLVSLMYSLEILRRKHLPIVVMRQGMDQSEVDFNNYMVEDKGFFGTDYLDFLCMLHSQIQGLIES